MKILVIVAAVCIGGPVVPLAEGVQTCTPGVVLRFDDAHPAAEWQELLDAFEAEGLKASFALPAAQVKNREQEAFLRRASAAGHEIMDHTHDHTMYSYGCRDAAEFERFRTLPIVAETNAALRLVGFRFTFDKSHPGNFSFCGFVTNGVLVVSPDVAKRLKRPNKIFVPSLGRFCGFFDDADGHIGLCSFYTYRIKESFGLPEGELILCDHRAFSIGDDILRFQAARSREAFRRIGLPDPKVWIQPGGWDPLLPVDSFRRVYEKEFGYRVADCIPGSSPKWNGDPQASDPALARFTFRPAPYFDSAAVPPDAVRRKILEAQARGRGICLLSHTWVPPTMKGGRREWMDETKKLLRWLKDQRIPVRTMSEMADLLWGERKGAEK